MRKRFMNLAIKRIIQGRDKKKVKKEKKEEKQMPTNDGHAHEPTSEDDGL